MNGKKWIKQFFIITFFCIVFTGSINFIIDPLWNFNHSNSFNKWKAGFNERQQKTNYINQNGLSNYEGILVGSSRSAYINQDDFVDMRIYNYSVSDMMPCEYRAFINTAKKIKNDEFKYIIIGLDFFGTNTPKKIKCANTDCYINNATSFLYKYKTLFSLDTLKQSWRTIKLSLKNKGGYRNSIYFQTRGLGQKRTQEFLMELNQRTLKLKGKQYQYNEEYIDILKQIKNENPKTKFIVFTNPITADHLVSIIKNANRMQEFNRWLQETIEVFGEVHHFMTINTITLNLQNYKDTHHYYQDIGKLLANKLANKENSSIPKDFGILLNNKNINNYMTNFKKQVDNYKNPLEL